MDKKEIKAFVFIAIIVLSIIAIIFYFKGDGNTSGNPEEVIKCIGEKAKLITSPTCGFCTKQKQALQDYYPDYEKYIEIIDVSKNPEVLQQYNLRGFPAWVVGEEVDYGAKTIDQLKKLVGC
jgi:glutaredoxin